MMLRRVALIALAILVLPVYGSPSASATESSVYGGACVMTMNASFSPGLTATPSAQTVNVSGGGLCQVNISLLATGLFAAGTSTISGGMSCSAGVSTGLGNFQLFGTPSLPSVSNGAVVIINAGGTFVIVFSWQIYRFVAVGEFAQADARGALCLAGTPQTGASLAGAFVLEDPTLPA